MLAVGGWMTSIQVVSFAFVIESGRLALLGAGVAAVFFTVHAHFAGASADPDLGPPTGMTGADLDRLIDEVDRRQGILPGSRGRTPQAVGTGDDDEFAELVRDALDELPDFMQEELLHVTIEVSDRGRTLHASGQRLYGLYSGGTVLDRSRPGHVYIFKDTLMDDHAGDPDTLRRQVAITVRHELAHHLGELSERRLRELGL